MKLLYSDLEKQYVLLEFRVTHSQMLIRCLKNEVDKRDYNIDILFKPVKRMILPDSFDGIAIFVLEDDEIPKFLINDFGFTTRLEYKVFLIKTRDGNSYYINSGIMAIFHNQLDMLESGWDRFSYYCGEKKLLY